jgi:hypothetical protein
MARRFALPLALAGALIACSGSAPSAPTPPTVSAVTQPSPPLPSPTPAPAPTAAPPPTVHNEPPAISGIDTCIGEAGAEHVFDLTLSDPDGDDIAWRASREEPRGLLEPTSGTFVSSGTRIQIRYRSPGVDENRIRVFATDSRGATVRMILYVRSG